MILKAWADYVCPWCYVGQVPAGRFSEEYGVPVDWQPFLLRPDAPAEGWPLPERIAARMNQPDNPLIMRAQKMGLPLKERSWVPNSRRALAANELIRPLGLDKLHAFHTAVNARYWGQGEDLAKWETLEAAAKDIGVELPPDTEELQRKVDEGLGAARELGIHAVPTYVLFEGDRAVAGIQGAQEYEAFQLLAKHLK